MDKEKLFLSQDRLQDLLDLLRKEGFHCVGPQVKDGAIVYEALEKASQLPWGIREQQAPGQYRLETIDKHRAFSWANGPQAIKPLLFKPVETVWKVARNPEGQLEFLAQEADEQPVALIGARACDIAGMLIQDKVFISNEKIDPRYKRRREHLLIVAVNCSYSSANCFCVSAGTGPEVKSNYDLLMTELDQGFVIQSGSDKGEALLKNLALGQANQAQIKEARKESQQAAKMQKKRMPLDNKKALRDLLFANLNHPRWDDVAERCLSCGNCTSVCPTCFCHSEKDQPSLDGTGSTHEREWDSCFTAGHSLLAGKPLRDDTKKRYRQWLTHKVGSWFDQFDSSGCVGCGRCVTWCPVGIDITEELAAISGESNQRKSDEK